ncbi:LysR family substrate-binding domain-containing protein [Stenotrophomonas maltophilia]|uniref:LysR family substrate-binding domain-containing protein n=1 Tax=Stenotrophomonas maltophilia TaxID=40324 RepID=UPI0031B8FB5D|nr:LysR family substrate-binding domain-containing protein [Stenotrophomonas maltophilia]HDS1132618.1 LysR family substrate-binding domain-containing protein [Stenotrophomonas maltophilia]
MHEVPLAQQIEGPRLDLYDVGFAQSEGVGNGILAEPTWHDPLVVAVPAKHPLASVPRLPLDEVLHYPLVMCDPQVREGQARQVADFLRTAGREPLVVEQVATVDVMMALIAAGFALGFLTESQCIACREHGIEAKPLAAPPMLTTYLLRLNTEPTPAVSRFIDRVAELREMSLVPGSRRPK